MTDKTAEKPATIDYSQTLFLPKTEFPMRAGLPQREPELLEALGQDGPVPQAARAGQGAQALRPA
jgi:isoleucyl-tRNA synthetase